jgi:hypothetical protein
MRACCGSTDRRDKEIIMTTGERLRAEGRIQGQVEVLLRQMARRFGPVPPAVESRVRAATPAELEAWTDRILTAPTLEAVFANG